MPGRRSAKTHIDRYAAPRMNGASCLPPACPGQGLGLAPTCPCPRPRSLPGQPALHCLRPRQLPCAYLAHLHQVFEHILWAGLPGLDVQAPNRHHQVPAPARPRVARGMELHQCRNMPQQCFVRLGWAWIVCMVAFPRRGAAKLQRGKARWWFVGANPCIRATTQRMAATRTCAHMHASCSTAIRTYRRGSTLPACCTSSYSSP